MPVYAETLTISPSTPKDSPAERKVTLRKGLLYRVGIQIPPGHWALTGLRIRYGEMQLWPTEPGTWFKGDDLEFEFEERWDLPEDPTVLRIEGYNEDDTYEHTFYIRLFILPPEEVSLVRALAELPRKIARAILRAFGWV